MLGTQVGRCWAPSGQVVAPPIAASGFVNQQVGRSVGQAGRRVREQKQ